MSSEQSESHTERRNRHFKADFARAMWDSLPEEAKERLREAHDDE